MTPTQRYELHQEYSKPLLDEFKKWLTVNTLLAANHIQQRVQSLCYFDLAGRAVTQVNERDSGASAQYPCVLF